MPHPPTSTTDLVKRFQEARAKGVPVLYPGPQTSPTVKARQARVTAPFDTKVLRTLTDKQIKLALERIDKLFGLEETALKGERTRIDDEFRQAILDITRTGREGERRVVSDALARGIFHSGIRQENIAEVQRDVTEAKARTTAGRTRARTAIEQALATLGSQRVESRATETQRIRDAALQIQFELANAGVLAEGAAPSAVSPEAIAAMLRMLIGR